jgi:predicted ATPase
MARKIMSDSNPPRLLSFTLDGWTVLGGPVTISLNDSVAVLVGRNGAGKSAILEGFRAISYRAVGRNRARSVERRKKSKKIEYYR